MFKKAERRKTKLRLGLCGLSNSGKTRGALEIATGMGGKIALIDTERRGHLYAEDYDYDIAELDAPYSPERYIEKIKEAEKAGYDILIIDSMSHAWSGEGGVLSIADQGGGTFQSGWKMATPKHNRFMDTIITSKIHIICCFRSKTEYVVEQNEKGKMAPRKIGLAPVQRDGMEYEFTLFMDLNQDHYARVTKDNTKLYDGQVMMITTAIGENLMTWLNTGKTAEEIHANRLSEVTELLKDANDIVTLKIAYAKCVEQFPDLAEEIKQIAHDKKIAINSAYQPQEIAQ